MAEQYIGQRVTVRGTEYQIMSIRHAGSNGSKFFGRYVFKLRRVTDSKMFAYLGVRVAANSKLYEAS